MAFLQPNRTVEIGGNLRDAVVFVVFRRIQGLLSTRDGKSTRHFEQLKRQSWRLPYDFFDILSQRESRIRAESLNDDVPQSAVSVKGRLVCLLACLRKFRAVKMQVQFLCKFLPCKGFQACNLISVVQRLASTLSGAA